MEYTIPFNADSMAANIVDSLREITDATLSSCIVGAEETCRLLKEHIKYVINTPMPSRPKTNGYFLNIRDPSLP